jgi:hypothetical protein
LMCFVFRLGAQLTEDKLGSLAGLRISERTTPLSTPEFTECQQLHLFPELKCSDSDRDTTLEDPVNYLLRPLTGNIILGWTMITNNLE